MNPSLAPTSRSAGVTATVDASLPFAPDTASAIAGSRREFVATGSLSRSAPQAVTNAGSGGRLAELPMVRVRAIVRAGERGAIQRMEQRNPARVIVPDLRVPQGNAGSTVLRALFPPGSVVVRTSAARTPPLQGYRPTGESLVAVEAAFTPQRIEAFGALGNEQKLLARSLLADLLPRLQAGTIGEAEFNLGVGLVLQAARNYNPPAPTMVPPASAPVVGSTLQGTRVVDVVPAIDVARAETVSAPLALPPLRLPPARPANFDITKVPASKVAAALDALESNDYPLSNPSHAARPADPIFKTWFSALGLLGTRSLTMRETKSLIAVHTGGNWADALARPDDDWSATLIRYWGAQGIDRFNVPASTGQGLAAALTHPHELHLFIGGGFRTTPYSIFRSLGGNTPGLGGENGFMANITDANRDKPNSAWGTEAAIKAFWLDDIEATRSTNTRNIDLGLQERILRISDLRLDGEIQSYVNTLWETGYLTDPREVQKIRPTIRQLVTTMARTPARVEAAKAMVESLRQREALTERVSISGVVAEIQIIETMYRYLEANQIDVRNPDHRIDAVEVYRLYERLLARGELTTRATVEGWLREWNVPSNP
jgi:hypothetical protein